MSSYLMWQLKVQTWASVQPCRKACWDVIVSQTCVHSSEMIARWNGSAKGSLCHGHWCIQKSPFDVTVVTTTVSGRLVGIRGSRFSSIWCFVLKQGCVLDNTTCACTWRDRLVHLSHLWFIKIMECFAHCSDCDCNISVVFASQPKPRFKERSHNNISHSQL